MTHYLDNSQHTMYLRCPALWYETYVRGLKPNYSGQRDDALCLGGLYHSAIEQRLRGGRPKPADDVIAEFDPTPDALDQATRWAHAYFAAYPADPWTVTLVEEPCVGRAVTARKCEQCSGTGRIHVHMGYMKCLACDGNKAHETKLLAKVDTIVELNEPLRIPGASGLGEVLAPGLYTLEHKTRGTSDSREDHERRWQGDTQAVFQIECARHSGYDVRGVIVNVCDKPYSAPPRRKCRNAACGETQPFDTYTPADPDPKGKPQFRCSLCGEVSQFAPPEPKPPAEPTFWRLFTTRTQAQIDAAYREFERVASEMDAIRRGERAPIRALGEYACKGYRRWCSFYDHHVAMTDPALSPDFVQIDNPLHYVWGS